jgi:hypothetical protein
MATIERRSSRFRLIFYVAGKRYTTKLKTTKEREAQAVAGAVDRTLMLLDQRVLEIPAGVDVVSFVLSGGKSAETPKPPPIRAFGELRDRYLSAHVRGELPGGIGGTGGPPADSFRS